ncbi:MAG: YggS family pyridoxal phosphate-dependent enzyme [Pyrinomonadaceae bacterium]
MSVSENIKSVRSGIALACDASGRAADSVKLVAVSKTKPSSAIAEAHAAGQIAFGENKVQEGVSKIAELGRAGFEWHLIGHLQKNKARAAILNFDVLQAIDSHVLAERLNRIAFEESVRPKIFLQVNPAEEASKSGVTLANGFETALEISRMEHLVFAGLMTIPPFFADIELVRPHFRAVRELRDRIADAGLFADGFAELSMGMSHDFGVAIEEGATIVRVGTAIFGGR